MAGGQDRLGAQRAGRHRLARSDRSGGCSDERPLVRVDQHLRRRVRAQDRVEIGDVVEVVMRQQDVRQLEAVLGDRREQGRDGAARVDEDRLPRVEVADEVRVRRAECRVRHALRARRRRRSPGDGRRFAGARRHRGEVEDELDAVCDDGDAAR